MVEITIYSRPGCHLCDEAKTVVASVAEEFGAQLREVNIDESAELRTRYTNDVPVIFIGSKLAAKHRVDPRRFRRQLEQARKQ
jgi:glutaredoxin